MSGFASAGNIPYLLIYTGIIVAVTIGVCVSLGTIVARKSLALARFICGIFVPILGFVGGFIVLATAPAGPPPNDAPAMLAYALWMLSAFALPISLVTSFIVFAIVKRPVR